MQQSDQRKPRNNQGFELLTVAKLGEHLRTAIDSNLSQETESRQIREKLQLIDYLFGPVAGDLDHKLFPYPDSEQIKKDDILCAYTFVLASEDKFGYNWSYLLNKRHALDTFFSTFKKGIGFIVDDLNAILSNLKIQQELRFEINGIFSIIISGNDTRYTIDLNRIFEFSQIKKNSYSLRLYYDKSLISGFNRRGRIADSEYIGKIQTIINAFVKSTKDDNNEPNK